MIHKHKDYLSCFFEILRLTKNITLVTHDWGSALGFHWAENHAYAIKGISYMEAIVKPVNWDDWPENARGIFQGFRSEKGEDLVLNVINYLLYIYYAQGSKKFQKSFIYFYLF